jgi:hypothetical protein
LDVFIGSFCVATIRSGRACAQAVVAAAAAAGARAIDRARSW